MAILLVKEDERGKMSKIKQKEKEKLPNRSLLLLSSKLDIQSSTSKLRDGVQRARPLY